MPFSPTTVFYLFLFFLVKLKKQIICNLNNNFSPFSFYFVIFSYSSKIKYSKIPEIRPNYYYCANFILLQAFMPPIPLFLLVIYQIKTKQWFLGK